MADSDYSLISIIKKNDFSNCYFFKLNKYMKFKFIFFIFILLFFINFIILFFIFKKYQFKLLIKGIFNNKEIINNSSLTKNNIKICICAPGKNENRYIREFLVYYEKYGIDKVFLYDNNDINGEKFEDIIKDFIDKGFVEILNWRGKKKTGYSLRDDCYLNNKKKFDWIIFYDLDEYIHLKNYSSIKAFLNEPKFKNCKKINLNWVIHTDNNLLFYDNRTLHERFPESEKNKKKRKTGYYRYKVILRGITIPNSVNYYKLISKRVTGCNGNGKKSQLINSIYMKNPDFDYYYIDHYYFKSVEEFIEKINKGDNYFGKKLSLKIVRINRFFEYNTITINKLNYIENKTGINLSKFHEKLFHKNLK